MCGILTSSMTRKALVERADSLHAHALPKEEVQQGAPALLLEFHWVAWYGSGLIRCLP